MKAPRSVRSPLLGWILVLLGMLYALLIGGAWWGIYSTSIRSATLVVVGVTIGTWAWLAWRSASWRPKSALLQPMLLAIASLAASTAVSPLPRLGVEYGAWALVLLGLYLLLVRLMAADYIRARIGSLCVLLALTLGSLFLATVVIDWIRWWQLVGAVVPPPLRPSSEGLVYGNPSAVMTIEVLLLAPGIAHLGFATVRARVMSALLIAIVAGVVVTSGSRAGWLGLGIAGVLFALVAAGRNRRGIETALRELVNLSRVRFGAVAAGVLILVAAVVVLAPGTIYRAASGGEALRATYLNVALRIFADHPILGAGPGTWAALRAHYTAPAEPDFYIPHAHNIYAQTGAELGFAGLGIGLLALLFLARLVRRALADQVPATRWYGWAALFSILYFGAHQLLDFYANMPAILLAFAIPIAYVDANVGRGSPSEGDGRTSGPSRMLGIGVAASMAVATLFLWTIESAAGHSDLAVDRLNLGDAAGALANAEAAARADPGMPAYEVTLGVALQRSGDWAAAADAFAKAADADDLANSWLAKAASEVELGRAADARDSLRRAMRLGAQQPVVAADAGWLYLEVGDRAAAIEAFAQALERFPSMTNDPAWRDRSELEPIYQEVVDAAVKGADPVVAWDIALAAGRPITARTLVQKLGPDERALGDTVIDAWGSTSTPTPGQEAAYAALTARAAREPLNEDLVVWCVRLAQHLGRYSDAVRFRDWIVIVSGGTSPAAGEVRMSFSGVSSAVPGTVGSLADFYGFYTYRRPTPFDMTPPGLPRLVLQIGKP